MGYLWLHRFSYPPLVPSDGDPRQEVVHDAAGEEAGEDPVAQSGVHDVTVWKRDKLWD